MTIGPATRRKYDRNVVKPRQLVLFLRSLSAPLAAEPKWLKAPVSDLETAPGTIYSMRHAR